MMRRLLTASLFALLAAGATAAPVSYDPPPETARLAPGPDVAVAEAHCLTCHSADYVLIQPRGLAQPTVFWTAEVNKMKKAYGAQIGDEDSAKIVAYLATTYAK